MSDVYKTRSPLQVALGIVSCIVLGERFRKAFWPMHGADLAATALDEGGSQKMSAMKTEWPPCGAGTHCAHGSIWGAPETCDRPAPRTLGVSGYFLGLLTAIFVRFLADSVQLRFSRGTTPVVKSEARRFVNLEGIDDLLAALSAI